MSKYSKNNSSVYFENIVVCNKPFRNIYYKNTGEYKINLKLRLK